MLIGIERDRSLSIEKNATIGTLTSQDVIMGLFEAQATETHSDMEMRVVTKCIPRTLSHGVRVAFIPTSVSVMIN